MKTAWSLALGPVAAVALATVVMSAPVAAANASLKIEPSTIAVANGQTFTVQVIQDAPEQTSGAQASIDFDPGILQVVSVALGSAYASAPVFVPQDMTSVLLKANQTGHLAQVAAAFLPPAFVPAGSASFLVVGFRVVGCGATNLKLPSGPFDAQMISGQSSGYGDVVPVLTTGGHVTTCVAPDAVTANTAVPASGGTPSGSVPLGLLGAVGLIAVGVLGALAWQSRRHAQQGDLDVAG